MGPTGHGSGLCSFVVRVGLGAEGVGTAELPVRIRFERQHVHHSVKIDRPMDMWEARIGGYAGWR